MTQAEPQTASSVPRLAEVVCRRAVELAYEDPDLAAGALELTRAANGNEDVLDRARAHAAGLLHANPKDRYALTAVVLLATAARQVRPRS